MKDPNGQSAWSTRLTAEKWVNGYAVTAVGLVLATAGIPGAATVLLCKMEAVMCLHIGKIYQGSEWSISDAKGAASAIGLVALLGKFAALESSIFLGPFVVIAKPAIAAGIVKALGQLVIGYFERLEPQGCSEQVPA